MIRSNIKSGLSSFEFTLDNWVDNNRQTAKDILEIPDISSCRIVLTGSVDINAYLEVYDGSTLLHQYRGTDHDHPGITVDDTYSNLNSGIKLVASAAGTYGNVTITTGTFTCTV